MRDFVEFHATVCIKDAQLRKLGPKQAQALMRGIAEVLSAGRTSPAPPDAAADQDAND